MSLLGIDLGTTGVRALVVDDAGTHVASAARPVPLDMEGGRAEVDAVVVSAAVDAVIRDVVGPLKDPVRALSFSTQGEVVLAVDAHGRALAPVPVSMDRRGVAVEPRIGRRLGPGEFARITGQPPHPMFSVHKIAAGGPVWHSETVDRYLTLDAHIARGLGAEPATDLSMAARTGLLDVDARTWSDRIVDAARAEGAARLLVQRLPSLAVAGQVIGSVSPEAAARTGLRPGTAIVAGAHDQAAAYLGAAGIPGLRSVFSLGSSDCLTVGSAERPAGLDGTGFASYPMGPSGWLTLAGTAAGGWALEWWARMLGTSVSEVFDHPAAAPSSVMVLPYLIGSGTLDNDPAAHGAIIGLTLGTTREDLARAFLEASAFEMRKIVDALSQRAGISGGEISAVGGGASNAVALAIRADAAGLPLAVGPEHASARGAALLAGVGIDVFPDLDHLPAPAISERATPSPDLADWYGGRRTAYALLYEVLRPLTAASPITKENP